MKLLPIQAMGIRAYCSDIIIDNEEDGTIYFMSVCGYQVTVKGLIANFLEQHGIGITVNETSYYLTRHSLGYKVLLRKLPSGLVHGLVFPNSALPGNDLKDINQYVVFAKNQEDLLSLFYHHLDEKTDIPLHPSWAGWLWEMFEIQGEWQTELHTIHGTYRGYLLEFNPCKLHELISSAIQSSVPEVVECFQLKGGRNG